MVSIEEYLRDPCRTLSLPYWKAKRTPVPPHMRVVHDREFCGQLYEGYADTRYFRLLHPLRVIPSFPAPHVELRVMGPGDIGELADVINRSYVHAGIRVSPAAIRSWTALEVCCPALWIGAFGDGGMAGSILCDVDGEVGEGVVEWLQVLPEYRGGGIASALLCRALEGMRSLADFATVSGQCGNPTAPERVYRRCGFEGDDVWHILRAGA